MRRPEGMAGADRASSGENDDVAEFYDDFRRFAEEATRRKSGDDRKPGQNKIAEALQVDPSTVSIHGVP